MLFFYVTNCFVFQMINRMFSMPFSIDFRIIKNAINNTIWNSIFFFEIRIFPKKKEEEKNIFYYFSVCLKRDLKNKKFLIYLKFK